MATTPMRAPLPLVLAQTAVTSALVALPLTPLPGVTVRVLPLRVRLPLPTSVPVPLSKCLMA